MLDARVGDESGINILKDYNHSLVDNIDVSFVFRNTVDKARYDMIFNATVLDGDSDPIKESELNECSTIVEVGGREIYRGQGVTYRSKKPFPAKVDLKFNVNFKCPSDWSDWLYPKPLLISSMSEVGVSVRYYCHIPIETNATHAMS